MVIIIYAVSGFSERFFNSRILTSLCYCFLILQEVLWLKVVEMSFPIVTQRDVLVPHQG